MKKAYLNTDQRIDYIRKEIYRVTEELVSISQKVPTLKSIAFDWHMDKPVESAQVDISAVNAMTERLEDAIEEVRKSAKIEHHHRHTIDIRSNWFFLSWVGLAIIILILFWLMANQRQTIGQYGDNDLKYRYIKMQGQTDEDNLYRLEQQFQYGDSIKIISKQVEKYEELVREQAEKIERVKRNTQEAEMLRDKAESLKRSK
jgi:hypothetical protein